MNIQDFQFCIRELWLETSTVSASTSVQPFLEFTAHRNGWLCTEDQVIIPDPIKPRAHIYTPQQLVAKFGSEKICEMLSDWAGTAEIDWKPINLYL